MLSVTILISALVLIACYEAAIANDARQNKEKVPNLGVVFPPPSPCTNTESGEFIRLEVSGCTIQPCQTAVGSQQQITVTFIPDRSPNHAYFHVIFYGITTNTTLCKELIIGPVIAEEQYTIYCSITMPEIHRGDVGRVQVDVYDTLTGDYSLSRCFDMLVSINT